LRACCRDLAVKWKVLPFTKLLGSPGGTKQHYRSSSPGRQKADHHILLMYRLSACCLGPPLADRTTSTTNSYVKFCKGEPNCIDEPFSSHFMDAST
jgi:hypothetical protein